MPSLFALVITGWLVALWVLGVVVVIALVWAMLAAARRGSPAAGSVGSLVFRYRPLVRWGSVCFAVGLLGFVTSGVVVHPPQYPATVVLVYALFGGMGAVLVWDVFRFRLAVGTDGLDCRSPWRPHFLRRCAEPVQEDHGLALPLVQVRNLHPVRVERLLLGTGGREEQDDGEGRDDEPHVVPPGGNRAGLGLL